MNCDDTDRLKKQTQLLIRMLDDPMSDLHIIINNNDQQHTKALRMLTRLFTLNGWEWELKRLCDIAIYKDETPIRLK